MITLFALLLATALAADTPLSVLPADLQQTFAEAETAWDASDLDRADALFVEVIDAAPDFDRAWRRRCGVLLGMGKVDKARAACRRAIKLNASVENRTGLAIALTHRSPRDQVPISPTAGTMPSPSLRPQIEEARKILEEVLAEEDTYLPAWQALCAWSVEALDDDALDRCIEALEATDPDNPSALYHIAIRHMADGELDEAARALKKARRNGLPKDKFTYLALRLGAAGAPPTKEVAQATRTMVQVERPEGSWTDAIPWVLAAGIVLTVGALIFVGGREDP